MRCVSINAGVMEAVMDEVDRIRAEHGLVSNAEAQEEQVYAACGLARSRTNVDWFHMQLLFVIEDIIEIKERGVVALGKGCDLNNCRFKIGDCVEIQRQDGSAVEATISGIPMGMMKMGRVEVFLKGIRKSDLHLGDSVWLK